VIFPDMPWVISPDAVSTQLRTALSKHWPVRARGRGRLYAFGFDAYRLVPLLKAGKFGNAHAVPGMTGLLSVDSKAACIASWTGRRLPAASQPIEHRCDERSELKQGPRSWTIGYARKRAAQARAAALDTCSERACSSCCAISDARAARSTW
jgi:hypothetical protein